MPDPELPPPAQTVVVAPSKLPDWTNNRFIVTLVVGVLSALGTSWVYTQQIDARLVEVEHQVKELAKLEISSKLNANEKSLSQLLGKIPQLDKVAAELETRKQQESIFLQKINDHISEIVTLRAKMNAIEIAEGKLDTLSVTMQNQVSTLEAEEKETCTLLAQIRERLATLEAQKATK